MKNKSIRELLVNKRIKRIKKKGWENIEIPNKNKAKYDNTIWVRKTQLKNGQNSNKTPNNVQNMSNNNTQKVSIKKLKKGQKGAINGKSPFLVKKGKQPKTLKTLGSGGLMRTGSKPPMGTHRTLLTPISFSGCNDVDLFNNNFSSFKSLMALRSDEDTLSIGFDTEWYGESPRLVISWQFALVKDFVLYEFIFLNPYKFNYSLLSIEFCIGVILYYLGYKSYRKDKVTKCRACVGFDSAGNNKWELFSCNKDVVFNSYRIYPLSVEEKDNHKKYSPMSDTIDNLHKKGVINKFAKLSARSNPCWVWFRPYIYFDSSEFIRVQLITHTGKVDISNFRCTDFDGWDNIMRFVSAIQGGTMSLKPHRIFAFDSSRISQHHYIFPVTLSVRDTMGQAPADKKSLAILGDTIGLPKLDDIHVNKSDMHYTFRNNTSLFFDYASRDSVITLLYFSQLYGVNKIGAPTLTGASATVMKCNMMSYLNCNDTVSFDRVYRGLEKVVKGKVPNPSRAGFIEESNKEPINRLCGEVQQYASQAYHGGFNGSSYIGWFDKPTFDYDLQGAYPTAMALVPDINWENPVLYEIQHEYISLDMFNIPVIGEFPLLPFVGYFRFEFPDNVKFPSIPISVDGSIVFPKTSDGLDGVYACGVEVFVALKLGATVYCDRGFVLNTLYTDNGTESRSLAYAIKQLLADRTVAKSLFGKKSLEELVLKTLANSGYGKVAQNVVQKSTWSSYCKEMKSLGASSITNPFSACFITSIVRAELIAIMNEISDMGYHCYSVTTDGFISDMPENLVISLPMLGLQRWIAQSRLFLTDGVSSDIWEIKHKQEHLLNLTTRGNMGLEFGGVSAHNSTRSPFDKNFDELLDRLWFIKACLTRVGAVSYEDSVWTTFKDLAQGVPFTVKKTVKNVRMDFDMKRKPDISSFYTVYPVVEGVQYEIANFETVPFDNVDECRRYRAVKKNVKVLRTQTDWNIFFSKLTISKNNKVRDMDWSILFSCVIGHRVGLWVIDELDNPNKTVVQKCEWLNSFMLSPKKQFKPSDWKNARRPERVSTMLPRDLLLNTLNVLGARII